jgi:predicted NBD/HSP70 family sugar kinase
MSIGTVRAADQAGFGTARWSAGERTALVDDDTILARHRALPAAPAAAEAGDAPALSRLSGGANQAGGRAYNERLTLSLIKLNGPLPKAELARLTGLSAQTLSQIVRRLEADGLLLPQEPLRGKVGQPSVPYALNPMGALSFGVKIGRRSADVVLCDLNGRILDRTRQTYDYPVPDLVLAFVVKAIARMRRRRPGQRFAGIGVATPFDLWKWDNEVEAPAGTLDGWRHIDLAALLAGRTGLAVYVANDASAACGAELQVSHRGSNIDLLYLFIGSFAGGGIVLNGALYQGRTGNAGALGSMPIGGRGGRQQLIHAASLLTLEKELAARGQPTAVLQDPAADWSQLGETLDTWSDRAAEALAVTIVSGLAVIDFGLVCIDGALPRPVLARLVGRTREAVGRLDVTGLSPFEISAGVLGADARALGGAMLPIMESFGWGQDVLLKAPAPAA